MLRIARVCTRRTSCDVIEAALAIDDHARRRRWAGGALAGPVARNGRRREPVRSGEGIGLGRVDVVMAGWCSVRGDRVCTHGAPALCARPFPRRRGCLRMHVEVPNKPAICSGTMGTLPVTRTSRASCVRRAVTRHAHGPRPTGGRGAAGGTGRIARPSPELQEVREPPAITPARRSPPSTTVTRSCTPSEDGAFARGSPRHPTRCGGRGGSHAHAHAALECSTVGCPAPGGGWSTNAAWPFRVIFHPLLCSSR